MSSNGNPTSRSYGYQILLDGAKVVKHFKVEAVEAWEASSPKPEPHPVDNPQSSQLTETHDTPSQESSAYVPPSFRFPRSTRGPSSGGVVVASTGGSPLPSFASSSTSAASLPRGVGPPGDNTMSQFVHNINDTSKLKRKRTEGGYAGGRVRVSALGAK